jgi:hypothetical protein
MSVSWTKEKVMKLRIVLGVAFVSALPAVAFAADYIKPGKWEISTEMKMAGTPTRPPITMNACVPKEKTDEFALPDGSHGGRTSDCKRYDLIVTGATVSYKIRCESRKMTGEGKITFGPSGDSYTGSVHLNMPGHEITEKLSAKRIGNCDK